MTVLTKEAFKASSLDTHILSTINKTKKLLIFYFFIVIVSSVISLTTLLPNESIKVAVVILDFIALLLLYDSFRYLLSLSKALKDSSLITTLKGKLTAKDKRKDTFYINNNELPKLQALDKSELRKFINENLEVYLIQRKIFLIIK